MGFINHRVLIIIRDPGFVHLRLAGLEGKKAHCGDVDTLHFWLHFSNWLCAQQLICLFLPCCVLCALTSHDVSDLLFSLYPAEVNAYRIVVLMSLDIAR